MAQNTHNPSNLLYRALTKIFSGPLTQFHTQGPLKLKRQQLDKYKFKSLSGQAFKKSTGNVFEYLYRFQRANVLRHERYMEFDEMDHLPEINAALNIYADEMTTSSPFQKMLHVECSNHQIKSLLEELFYNILNIEYNLFGWARSLCKYGDFFLYIDTDEKLGVKNAISLPQEQIERLEGQDPTNPNYVQFQWNSAGQTFEYWQVAHFRVSANDKFAPYGTSILDGARRISRQLQLLENNVMAYRIVRSPERRAYYIDVAGIPDKEVEQHMENIITNLKRNQVIDQDSGRVEERYNPWSIDEDIFIPVRGEKSGTRIEPLPGGQYTGDMDDVVYLQNKLLAALQIPRSYLIESITSEGGGDNKTTLAQKDIRFARTIQRLQRFLIPELYKMAIIHLYILGFKRSDLKSFKLRLNNPSKIAELMELEHWKTKFEVASTANEGYFSKRWIATNILDMSDEDFERNTWEMFYDKYIESQLDSMSGETLGGDEGDMGGGGLGDIGSDSESAGKDEEDILLASPGNRNDAYTTPGSKGKAYTPETTDKRDNGARTRSMKSKWANEFGMNTPRNVFKGASELKTMAKGIFEDQKTIYERKEEKEIINDDRHVEYLIEMLNNVKNKKEEKNE